MMVRFRNRVAEILTTAPSFVWLLLFFAVPTVIVLSFTFHGHTPNGGVAEEWSLVTWRSLVNPDYPAIVWRTIRISFEVTLWCILLALPSAYAIARLNQRWRGYVAGLIMLPFWTSFVVRVFAWKTMLHPDGWLQACWSSFCRFRIWLFDWLPGFMQTALTSTGFVDAGGDAASTMILDSELAVLIVSVYSFLPFAIMPIYTAAEKFDFSLMEAARDLGARNFYAFRKIFIPGVKQGIVSAVLMVFIPAIGSYVIPQMLGGTNCVLIGNKIFMRAIQNRNIPHASALATLMALSVLVPLACVMWWRRRQSQRDQKRLAAETARRMGGLST